MRSGGTCATLWIAGIPPAGTRHPLVGRTGDSHPVLALGLDCDRVAVARHARGDAEVGGQPRRQAFPPARLAVHQVHWRAAFDRVCR